MTADGKLKRQMLHPSKQAFDSWTYIWKILKKLLFILMTWEYIMTEALTMTSGWKNSSSSSLTSTGPKDVISSRRTQMQLPLHFPNDCTIGRGARSSQHWFSSWVYVWVGMCVCMHIRVRVCEKELSAAAFLMGCVVYRGGAWETTV